VGIDVRVRVDQYNRVKLGEEPLAELLGHGGTGKGFWGRRPPISQLPQNVARRRRREDTVEPGDQGGGPQTRTLRLLGAAALACYAIHGGFHLAQGRWYDLLWACHLGAVLVGIGLLARDAALNGVGVLLLSVGTPLWLMDLATGGEFFPTSILTHVVALVIGLYGAWRIGWPRGTWWKAAAGLAVFVGLCRLATPAEANVNVAFAVPRLAEAIFPSHTVYLACVIAAAAGYFWIVEQVLWRVLPRRGG
jgi:hypothetical protein